MTSAPELPSVVNKPEKAKPKPRPTRKRKAKASTPAKPRVHECSIDVPVADIDLTAYASGRVDIRGMSRAQRDVLKRVTLGLQEKQAKLLNGKVVKNNQDAFKWMLEALAANE